jgi:hypothetical protein
MQPDSPFEALKTLIVKEFVPRGTFSAQDVYLHPSNPADLDMYGALDELVEEGVLFRTHTPPVATHTEMTYQAAPPGIRIGMGISNIKAILRLDLRGNDDGE